MDLDPYPGARRRSQHHLHHAYPNPPPLSEKHSTSPFPHNPIPYPTIPFRYPGKLKREWRHIAVVSVLLCIAQIVAVGMYFYGSWESLNRHSSYQTYPSENGGDLRERLMWKGTNDGHSGVEKEDVWDFFGLKGDGPEGYEPKPTPIPGQDAKTGATRAHSAATSNSQDAERTDSEDRTETDEETPDQVAQEEEQAFKELNAVIDTSNQLRKLANETSNKEARAQLRKFEIDLRKTASKRRLSQRLAAIGRGASGKSEGMKTDGDGGVVNGGSRFKWNRKPTSVNV